MPTPGHQSYAPISAGAQLRAYRENAQLTVDDVAHHLKLARRQVLAIENDEFDALPGPTFVRGFIRNYARLLRIDPLPILEAGNLLAPPAAPVEQVAPTMTELPAARTRSGSFSRWLIPLGLVLALAAGIAYFEFGDVSNGMRKKKRDPTDAVVALPASPPEATAGRDSAMSTSPAPLDAPLRQSAPAAGAASATLPANAPADAKSAAQPDPQIAAGTGRIDFVLSGASWIEVKDSRGEVLLSRTLDENTQQSVTGVVPLSLKIGNARAVKLQFNGSPVELAPYTQREIARLSLPLPRK